MGTDYGAARAAKTHPARCSGTSPSSVTLDSEPPGAGHSRDVGRAGAKSATRSEVDGAQAWLTLACVVVMNATTLGSLKVYGLIFEKIVNQGYYNREQASWPISTASTVQNLTGLLTPLLSLKVSWRSIEIGQTLLFVSANLGAYVSNSLATDILCIGVVQGVALSLRYNMNVVLNNEYFERYRTTAMGICLAGSTGGVFLLKPLIALVLDNSDNQFRRAYLTLAAVMSGNIIFSLFIRRPKVRAKADTPDSGHTEASFGLDDDDEPVGVKRQLVGLLKNPNIHCIWIMQTLYFYISRTYTIFIVDYGVDKGFSTADSRNFLDFWVYGEIGGRLLLGPLVDSGVASLKWNIVMVSCLLALSGFAPLLASSMLVATTDTSQAATFWLLGASFSLVAALSSLVNMMIIPFGQEYLGRQNVPWAFAIGSVVTSILLLLRPALIGLSRDEYKSYDLLITVMASGPLVFGLAFAILEPLYLSRRKFNAK